MLSDVSSNDEFAEPRGRECALPVEETEARLAALRAAMDRAGFDVALVTGPENLFWLTGRQTPGHASFQVLVLPLVGEPVLLVRTLERHNALWNTRLDDIRTYGDDEDPVTAVLSIVAEARGGRVALEAWSTGLLPHLYARLVGALGAVQDATPLLARLRAVKSPFEIKCLERAAAFADAGLLAGVGAAEEGASENDVAAAMLAAAVSAGSDYLGMEPLVSSGPRSGVPHATWRGRILRRGDGVFAEMAASHRRYHSAIYRPVWVGSMPDEARRMLEAAQEGLAAGLDRLVPGNSCACIHRAVEAVIARHGFLDAFRKRSGYSMGVAFAPDWGEGDVLSLYHGVQTPLQAGMVFHMPIALRAYGRFTIGMSETAVVEPGGARCLSQIPRLPFEKA